MTTVRPPTDLNPIRHYVDSTMRKWEGKKGTAVFCWEECHRYRLDRDLVVDRKKFTPDPYAQNINFILLNPSTASADINDPTIQRTIGFANGWGYETLTITNLFAIRSTDPKILKKYDRLVTVDPSANDYAILSAARDATTVVLGWGVHGAIHNRGLQVIRDLSRHEIKLYTLGRLTKDGFPRHPLYLRGDIDLARFPTGVQEAGKQPF